MTPPAAAVDRFTSYLEASERSPHTVRCYRSDLGAFGRWFEATRGERLEPERITATDLRAFRLHLSQERGLSPTTVNRRLAALSSFVGWAAQAGLVAAVPDMPRRLVAIAPGGPRWLEPAEKRQLERAVELGGSLRDRAIVAILLHTGLRVAELCGLRWHDVAMTQRSGKVTVTGKGRRRREVPLNRTARRAFEALGHAAHAGSDGFVFVGQRGALTGRGVQYLLAGYTKTAGLDHVSPHTLRHTFCKSLIDAGASLHEVAALAGHDSLETTRRYSEPSRRDLERAVALLDDEG